jgi:hypothetical protein
MAAGLATGARNSDLASMLLRGHERHREVLIAEQHGGAHPGSTSRTAGLQPHLLHPHHTSHYHHEPHHHHRNHPHGVESSSRIRSAVHRTPDTAAGDSSGRHERNRTGGVAVHRPGGSGPGSGDSAIAAAHTPNLPEETLLTAANLAELDHWYRVEARKEKRADVHGASPGQILRLSLSLLDAR